MSTVQGSDLLLVNRNRVSYKIEVAGLDLILNPPPAFTTTVVDIAESNWSPYVSLVAYPSGDPIPDSEFFYWPDETRNPDRIFNGDPNNGYDAACNTENVLVGDSLPRDSLPEGRRRNTFRRLNQGCWNYPWHQGDRLS